LRADQLLVQRGLAPSRSAAQRLIGRGAVQWRPLQASAEAAWQIPRKAGDDLPEACELQLSDDAELRWASRAGLKLDAALDHTGIDVRGATCLDVGQSTGGFTDVLLARGAKCVVGVDVGHGQIVQRLRSDPRVTVLEGINARTLDTVALPLAGFDFVCADVSFISLTLVLPALAKRIEGVALLLIKPQFELQPAQIGKGGIVSDPAFYPVVERRIRSASKQAGLQIDEYFPSHITGNDGNREYFAQAAPMNLMKTRS
jgi:23S rRNA (cytidine1920-2'-O)/16S rRNA (cytidine1409-2'-O)-methyltransferase